MGEELDEAEAQQYQHMIYNLMVGDEGAYGDIDKQRKSEKNYKFSWDESLIDKTQKKIQATVESNSFKEKDISSQSLNTEENEGIVENDISKTSSEEENYISRNSFEEENYISKTSSEEAKYPSESEEESQKSSDT